MADRVTETKLDEAPEIPEVLERVLVYCLDEARRTLEAGHDVIPFTALAVTDKLFMERHASDTVEGCYATAQHEVERARGASAYGFCYDGYIELDDRTVDALIAEGGIPGDPVGYAIGHVYRIEADGSYTFEDVPTFVGDAPNFMEHTNDLDEEEEAQAADEAAVAAEAVEAADAAEAAAPAE